MNYQMRSGVSPAARRNDRQKAEATGSITLESLEREAQAIDYHLVNAFVSRNPLDTLVNERTTQRAQKRLESANHTMALGTSQTAFKNGLVGFMSRKGNCHDNAPNESFWGGRKNEMAPHQRFETQTKAESAIREYIEIFYNRQRRHSRIGYLAPAVFAQTFTRTAA